MASQPSPASTAHTLTIGDGEQPKSSTVFFHQLRDKCKKNLDLYEIISTKYKLPSLSSRAIARNYLKSCMLEPCPVFRIQNKDFRPIYVRVRHSTAAELYDAIEELLKRKNLPPLGFNKKQMADLDWLTTVYFYLCPEDDYELFPKRIGPGAHASFNIDPDLVKAIEEHPTQFKGRSAFTLTDDQQLAFQQQCLQKKMAKQKAQKERITEILENAESNLNKYNMQIAEIQNKINEKIVNEKTLLEKRPFEETDDDDDVEIIEERFFESEDSNTCINDI